MQGLTNVKMVNGGIWKEGRMFNHGKRGIHGRRLELVIAGTSERKGNIRHIGFAKG
jgi:hypothetical protein